MDYNIVMPQLSDSMEEGKLISWKVKEGDRVKRGDVIAEVESDKAIMEVQTFKEGVVKKILVKEGESVSVGKPIAVIDTEEKEIKEQKEESFKEKEEKSIPFVLDEIFAKAESENEKEMENISKVEGMASPKAKREALEKRIDIKKLQEEGKLPSPAHFKDIKEYEKSRYFTPKAWKLLKDFGISSDMFDKNRKYTEDDILDFIRENDIPFKKRVDSIQKAIIENVTASSKKPVFHIYDFIDASLIKKHNEYSVTVWMIKLIGEAMMEHEAFRRVFKENEIEVYPNASISVAMTSKEALFMPVFKRVNLKSVEEISKELKEYKEKVKTLSLRKEDMEGSTFGISNLGMFNIFRFDAMINKNDSGIIAIGAERDGKIAVTLTLDHRVINGYEGALFMNTLKFLAVSKMFFK